MPTFLTDSFTDTDGVLIENHVGETGASWTRAFGVGNCVVQTNRVYFSGAGWFTSSGIPGSADYYVEAIFRKLGAGAAGQAAISLRHEGGTNYAVSAQVPSSIWKLWRYVNGGSTALAEASQTFVQNTEYTVRLEANGSTIKVYVDTVEILSVADTAITSVGAAGLVNQASAANTTTSGIHVVSMSAADGTPVTTPAITSLAPTSGTPDGGTSVVITGTNFTTPDVSAVSFGAASAASFVVDSSTQITAVSPAGIAGQVVDVSVASAEGTSANVAGDNFTYDQAATPWTPSTVRIKV